MVGLETRLLRFSFLCKLQDMGDKWPHETESSDLRPGNLTLNTGLSCDTQAQGQQTETACFYVPCGSGASQDWRGLAHFTCKKGVSAESRVGGLEQGREEGETLILVILTLRMRIPLTETHSTSLSQTQKISLEQLPGDRAETNTDRGGSYYTPS